VLFNQDRNERGMTCAVAQTGGEGGKVRKKIKDQDEEPGESSKSKTPEFKRCRGRCISIRKRHSAQRCRSIAQEFRMREIGTAVPESKEMERLMTEKLCF